MSDLGGVTMTDGLISMAAAEDCGVAWTSMSDWLEWSNVTIL